MSSPSRRRRSRPSRATRGCSAAARSARSGAACGPPTATAAARPASPSSASSCSATTPPQSQRLAAPSHPRRRPPSSRPFCGLSRANHPNILPFYGIVVDDARQPLFMATALVESGTLRDMCVQERYAHLRSDGEGLSGGGASVLSHALVVDVLLDVFLALEYLHTRAEPVIHRDVKPANVLVEFSASGQFVKAMLADLGEAKQFVIFGTRAAQSLGSVGVGTLIYMAPEMKEEDEMKGPKVDVFSLGVAAAEIATGRCPAPGPEMVREGRRRVAVPEEERRADDIRTVANDDLRTQVVARCITDDPAERGDAAEMVAACRQLQRTAAYRDAKAVLEPQQPAAAGTGRQGGYVCFDLRDGRGRGAGLPHCLTAGGDPRLPRTTTHIGA